MKRILIKHNFILFAGCLLMTIGISCQKNTDPVNKQANDIPDTLQENSTVAEDTANNIPGDSMIIYNDSTQLRTLSANTWIPNEFILNGKEYPDFNWYCYYTEAISDESYLPGDSANFIVTTNLVFTADHFMYINENFQWLKKCKDCNSYTVVNDVDNPRGGPFRISGDTLYTGTYYQNPTAIILNDTTLLYFHYFEVYDYYSECECSFNDFDLGEDTTFNLNVIFSPKH